MPTPFLFLKQPHSGADSKLCGFFAMYHFENGNITRDQYIAAAINVYKQIGVSDADAAGLAADGNDPSVFEKFGLIAGDKSLVEKFEVLIVCDTTRGHFFTIRKENGQWWSYDSWTYDKAELIGNDAAAKQICNNFPIYYKK